MQLLVLVVACMIIRVVENIRGERCSGEEKRQARPLAQSAADTVAGSGGCGGVRGGAGREGGEGEREREY